MTGLLVAVAMVGLVLLLNTAIFTENLASRGADQSAREAVEYRATVADGVGGLVDAENRREHGGQAAVEANVSQGVERIDDFTARRYGLGGTVVRVNDSSVTLHEGKLIRQTDETRNFLNASPTTPDWRLADDVEDTRAFTMTVDRTSLVDTTDSNARSDDAFHVLLEGSTDWELFVYQKGGSEIAIATVAGGGVPTERCTVASADATVDLTAGTLDGEDCPGLAWADGISGGYHLAYRDGHNAQGTYNLTVNTTGSADVNTTNLNDGTANPSSPYFVPAVYSASFDATYESPSLTYRSRVRVAPGESE